MTKIEKNINLDFYNKIAELLRKARKTVVQSVNKTMVYTYFEIGKTIVEEEQKGKIRAEYGKKIIKELSQKLIHEFGKGFSSRNLEQMRKFYLVYGKQVETEKNQKTQTLSAKLDKTDNQYPKFNLSWSHYLFLMGLEDIKERKFYEIEAYNNNWSLRELRRQYDTALYQRLVLSRDKKGMKELSQKGQILEKPEDTVKDPYVLEFLGLPESQKYSETELEQKLIDKLEHFLLELGKGFAFVGRQVRFTFEEEHFRIDLVFYNRLLQCFV